MSTACVAQQKGLTANGEPFFIGERQKRFWGVSRRVLRPPHSGESKVRSEALKPLDQPVEIREGGIALLLCRPAEVLLPALFGLQPGEPALHEFDLACRVVPLVLRLRESRRAGIARQDQACHVVTDRGEHVFNVTAGFKRVNEVSPQCRLLLLVQRFVL